MFFNAEVEKHADQITEIKYHKQKCCIENNIEKYKNFYQATGLLKVLKGLLPVTVTVLYNALI